MANDTSIAEMWIYKKSNCISVVNHHFGTRCGYCSVSGSHPFFMRDYSYIVPSIGKSIDYILSAHGGITYSGNLKINEILEREGLWWFGFDCNHSGDAADINLITNPISKMVCEQTSSWLTGRYFNPGKHRTLEYVKENCNNLAEQLSKFKINSLDFIKNDN